MKTYIYKLIILLFVMTLAISCSLDLEPDSIFTELTVESSDESGAKYTTKRDMDMLIGGIYSGFKGTLQEVYNLDMLMLTDVRSDNAYSGSIEGWSLELDNFNVNPNNTVSLREWSLYFSMIGHANLIINNVDNIPDPAMTAALKKEYKAEALILRAMMYFDLIRYYGDVPLILQETPDITSGNIEEVYPLLYPSREDKDVVYQQIIEDLEYGAENGPVTTSTDKFKLTRALANGLLAKVYATIENKDWSKVKAHCENVLSYNYPLLANYDDLWAAGSRNTSESIFEITHSADAQNWGWMMFSGTDWRKFCTPSHDLEKVFDAERDVIRKESSIRVDACSWDNFWPANQYRFANKLRNGLSSIIVMRSADIMLLQAEALIELGAVDDAASLIDKVRNRVNLAPLSTSDKKDQASMRLAVEKERRLELAFEGQRWFDLIRTRRAVEVMKNCKDSKGNNSYAIIEDWMLLYPVPQTERDNNPNLTQNAGY